jgi:hypothetical protein
MKTIKNLPVGYKVYRLGVDLILDWGTPEQGETIKLIGFYLNKKDPIRSGKIDHSNNGREYLNKWEFDHGNLSLS